MKNRKKLLIGVLVATMALAGAVVGTVSADSGNNDNPKDGLMARAAEILGIDQQEVEDAFTQATEEVRAERQEQMETAREVRLQALIDEGVLTQDQVDEMEAWLGDRPDNRDGMQEWLEARPADLGKDFPALSGGRGMMPGGHDMTPGGHGMTPGGQGMMRGGGGTMPGGHGMTPGGFASETAA